MGRGPSAGGGRDRRGRQRFAPLDAATTAREGAGDSSGRHLGHAVSGLDFTEVINWNKMTILPLGADGPKWGADKDHILFKEA
ncbi:hypothetical protein CRG98_025561 [Punica granatum]|uniref:Uncharacterized protein n=1 Tax=Punica granatum TaxID=22663 RepID=A0A2I0JCV6_PUNGR|nr:hypothetical protein CRG98_025561 [Punica granatum]